MSFAHNSRRCSSERLDLREDDPQRVIVDIDPGIGRDAVREGRDGAQIAAENDRFNEVCRLAADSVGARFVDITAISRKIDGRHFTRRRRRTASVAQRCTGNGRCCADGGEGCAEIWRVTQFDTQLL